MCHFETDWGEDQRIDWEAIKERLAEMEADGLVIILDNGLVVTNSGKPFVRNICMALDLKLYRNKPTTTIFSQTV